MTATATVLDEDTTFNAGTMRVLANMSRRVMETNYVMPESVTTREELAASQKRFSENLAEMLRTYAMAMSYVATPGVRLWPDNGREDCLSLSGSLHGMGFGIIWRENADGTGSWSFHS